MRKQVIFLMTDTTRKDMVGCYGYPKMKTPNLDRLAEEGIRYENAYTCQPVCGPARSAIFTGTFPHTNGMVTNSIALGDNVKTIGQRLYDHGIQCGYIGKWHLDGSDYFGNGRCPEGWDPEYWYDMKTYLNELTDEEKVKLCQICAQAGADFVKTSTGFTGGGATVEDVRLMRAHVPAQMQVKASGGVRTRQDFDAMVAAGATRIGASSGVKILEDK